MFQTFIQDTLLNKQSLRLILSIVALFLMSSLVIMFTYHDESDSYSFEQPLEIPELKQTQNNSKSKELEDNWQSITVQPGASLFSIFNDLDISQSSLSKLVDSHKHGALLKKLKPKQQLHILVDDENNLIKINYPLSPTETLKIEKAGDDFKYALVHAQLDTRVHYSSGIVSNSLSQAGNDAGLSEKLILELASIFAWDVDFAKDIRPGDSFTVIFEDHYQGDKKILSGNILASQFINNGKIYQAIRYTNASNQTEYYTKDGKSLKAAFLRSPVKYTRISSRFNLRRRHPILHTIRAHKGVDYAAPRGTPIKASGNGKVIFMGRKGGYGKAVILKHGKKYTTLYAHLSRYATKLKTGTNVKQGQIIGYVGKTGLATANHLHYEFRINGKHYNPMKVSLPQAKGISKSNIKSFHMVSKPLLSQLALYHKAHMITTAKEDPEPSI